MTSPTPRETARQIAEQSEDTTTVNAITAVVRDADQTFERVGGSSRHWVRDCFLPILNQAGYVVVPDTQACRYCGVPIRLRGENRWEDAETHSTCDTDDATPHEPITNAEVASLTAALAQAQQERDEWKRRAEDAEGRIANALV